MGSREDVAARIDQDTIAKIEGMKKQVANNKEQVMNRLLEIVCEIKPELHRNYRPNM
jgi:V-type H+-transporting ATPase subunit G